MKSSNLKRYHWFCIYMWTFYCSLLVEKQNLLSFAYCLSFDVSY